MTKKLFTLTVALLLFCAPCFLGCEPTEKNIENPSKSNHTNELLEAVTVDWKGEKVTVGYSFEPETSWDLVNWYKFGLQFENGYARIRLSNGKYAYMNANGDLLDNGGQGYDFVQTFNEDGIANVKLAEDKWAYIDTNENIVSESLGVQTAIPYHLEDNYYWYIDEKTGLRGFCDENQKHISDPIYKEMHSYADGIAYVTLANDKRALINFNGEIKAEIPEGVRALTVLKEGVVRYNFKDLDGNSYRTLYDVEGNRLCEEKFDYISDFYDGLALIIKDRKIGLIDKEGDILLQPTFEYDEVWVETGTDPLYFLPKYMDENKIIIPVNNKIAILEILRT